jgi:hypothetical protein
MSKRETYWKCRLVLVREGGNMRSPEYICEWYLSDYP